MEKNAIADLLVDPARNFASRNEEKILTGLEALRTSAEATTDEDFKNEVWVYTKIARAQFSFIRAFSHCKLEEYYSGWCEYEVAERILSDIQSVITSNRDTFAVDFMARQTLKFQSLFPYCIFASMGLEIRKRHCSICGATHGLKRGCDHQNGRLYSGKMCKDMIGDSRILEISMVEKPVFKSAVPFSVDSRGNVRDHYDYSMIGFVVDRLKSPFAEWNVTDTYRVEPHAKYLVGRNDKCPCGSAKKYKNCCLNALGIRFSHKEITFGEGSAPHLPATVLPGKLRRSGTLFRRADASEPWATLASPPVPPSPTTVREGEDYRRQIVTAVARVIDD